jgi:hypothetical protein
MAGPEKEAQLSMRGDAILITDEAGVALEERSSENLQRNTVVSGLSALADLLQ